VLHQCGHLLAIDFLIWTFISVLCSILRPNEAEWRTTASVYTDNVLVTVRLQYAAGIVSNRGELCAATANCKLSRMNTFPSLQVQQTTRDGTSLKDVRITVCVVLCAVVCPLCQAASVTCAVECMYTRAAALVINHANHSCGFALTCLVPNSH
jgi:hypothetical protein